MAAVMAVGCGSGAAWTCSAAGAIGEPCLEDALQLGWPDRWSACRRTPRRRSGLSILDLRSPGDEFVPMAASSAWLPCSEALISVSAEDSALLIGRADGAGVYFRLQFILQLLEAATGNCCWRSRKLRS